ncbi:hypothetical protein [Streptomyces sp. NPDC002994]|uniref:hypothetical protein n=1 Tax=Streptomyces sp. NPDC002994 TaxID=3154441 RepID=UPI0033AB9967
MSSQGPATPDPGRAPSTPEEALRLVLGRFGQPRLPDGSPAPMRVEEFDIGYVVYAVFPQPTAVNGVPRPAEPGGSHVVVAKDDGETALVPNFPPELAIEVFRRHYRATERTARHDPEENQ